MTKPIFNFDDEEELENVEETPAVNPNRRVDKIFNNDYNTGNLDFEEYSTPKVDDDYVEDHLEYCYDSGEYHEKKILMERIDEQFKGSTVGKELGIKRKIPKHLLPTIYLEIKNAFKENELTESQFFINVAEYFGMSYEILYENIPAIYREELVKELDNKFAILNRKGIKKLF